MSEILQVPFVRVDRNAHGRETVVRGAPCAVPGAVFWPEQSVTASDGNQRVVRPARIAVPHSQPSDPRDQWMVDGVRYQAGGDVSRWRNPFAPRSAGATVAVERVTG